MLDSNYLVIQMQQTPYIIGRRTWGMGKDDAPKVDFETIDKEKYETDNEKAWVLSSMKGESKHGPFSYYFLNAEGEANRKGLTIRNKEDIPALLRLITRVADKL